MERVLFRFSVMITVIFVSLIVGSEIHAQDTGSPFQYRLEYGYLPPGTTYFRINKVAEVNDGATTSVFVVGRYTLNGVIRGFVYDQKNDNFIDVISLLGIENSWSGSSCVGINSNGIVVGSVEDSTGSKHGIWFDFFNPTMNLLEDQFPDLEGDSVSAYRINNSGDVLLHYRDPVSGVLDGGGVANIYTSTMYPPLDPGSYPKAINQLGCVVGYTSSGTIFRYYLDVPNSYEEFTELTGRSRVEDVNVLGEFCGTTQYEYRRNKYQQGAFRFGNQLDWISDPYRGGWAHSLNDAGDVAFQSWSSEDGSFFYHSDLAQMFLLTDLVNDAFFESAIHLNFIHLTEQQSLSVPTPIITGKAVGSNAEERMFFLIPEEPGQTPGITVTPANGLVTTEGGGTDSFTVVLDTQPTADVTINLSLPDTTEGMIVSDATLTFSTALWDIEQTVDVKGVQDSESDGDVTYSVTATATGGGYDGLTADVTVTNQDDEVSNITMSVDDPSVTEGDRKDKTRGEFTITLSAASASDVQVWYQVSNGSAGNKDYRMVDSASGVLDVRPRRYVQSSQV